MIKRLDHLVITTSNPERCANFYKVLGFDVVTENGRMELHCDCLKINVHTLGKELQPHATNVMVGSADICFEVDCSLDDVLKTLESNGVDVLMSKVPRTGRFGPITSIYVIDPDGNLIELMSYNS